MEITNYQDLVGYSWYAADTNGHIAIFSNAGVGEIPVYLRQDKDKYEEIINAWDDYVEKHLPIRGRADVSIVKPGVLTVMERSWPHPGRVWWRCAKRRRERFFCLRR